jgi:hypothetical protein
MKHELSIRIDAIVVLLDSHPPTFVRFVLRLWKRWLERNIPA